MNDIKRRKPMPGLEGQHVFSFFHSPQIIRVIRTCPIEENCG